MRRTRDPSSRGGSSTVWQWQVGRSGAPEDGLLGTQLEECWRGPIGPWPQPLCDATIQGCDPSLPGHAACAQRVRATAPGSVCPARVSEGQPEGVAPRFRARATSTGFGTKDPSGVGRPAGSRCCSRWLLLVRWRPAQAVIPPRGTELRPVVRSAPPPPTRACRRDERLTRSSSLPPTAGDWPWRAGVRGTRPCSWRPEATTSRSGPAPGS